MPTTALNHFNQDVARARAIVTHADPLPRTNAAEQMLRSDLLRSAWMFAVGAMRRQFGVSSSSQTIRCQFIIIIASLASSR